MEFGRVTEKELDKIDFTLPEEPAANKLVLKKTKKNRWYIPGVLHGGEKNG